MAGKPFFGQFQLEMGLKSLRKNGRFPFGLSATVFKCVTERDNLKEVCSAWQELSQARKRHKLSSKSNRPPRRPAVKAAIEQLKAPR